MAEEKAVTNEVNDETEARVPERSSRKRFVIIFVVAVVVIVAALFWWRSTFTEDTDDAQVDGDLYQISARVGGQVTAVPVAENQEVKAGDVIAQIDPRDYEVAVQQDEANLAAAEANYEAARVNVPITDVSTGTTLTSAGSDVSGQASAVEQAKKQVEAAEAAVLQAKANAIKTQLDLDRYTPLVQKDVISKQQFDGAVQAADAAKAALAQAEAQLLAAQAGVRQAQDKLAQSKSSLKNAQTGRDQVAVQKAKADQALGQVQQAQAQLDQAKLNLQYTKITAPIAGIVNKKTVAVGQNVSVGQNLLTLVPLDNLWVTANFKETQLLHMKQGQEVDLKVDAYSGRVYHGKVSQIGGATGSRLSLFPPENATGNYVKVVQRIPVRIDFTNEKDENKDHLLRPGFSVTPEVKVK